MRRLGILASGKGMGLQAIIDHVRLGVLLNVKIAKVVVNNAEAEVFQRASAAGTEALFIEGIVGKKYVSAEEKEQKRKEFDDLVSSMFLGNHVSLVICAGFNQVLSSVFVSRYPNKIMNIHPAYDIERFGGTGMIGMKVHETVLKARERVSGCAIHYVDTTVDRGPVIYRASVPVFNSDTPDTLADRVTIIEHRTYSKVIQLHVDNKISVQGKKVMIDLGKNWESEWNVRQQKYIEHQKKLWDSMGKNIDKILGVS